MLSSKVVSLFSSFQFFICEKDLRRWIFLCRIELTFYIQELWKLFDWKNIFLVSIYLYLTELCDSVLFAFKQQHYFHSFNFKNLRILQITKIRCHLKTSSTGNKQNIFRAFFYWKNILWILKAERDYFGFLKVIVKQLLTYKS